MEPPEGSLEPDATPPIRGEGGPDGAAQEGPGPSAGDGDNSEPEPTEPAAPPTNRPPGPQRFDEFITLWLSSPRVSADRTLAVFLPLLQQVQDLHGQLLVAPLDRVDELVIVGGVLALAEGAGAPARRQDEVLRRIAPPSLGGVGHTGVGSGTASSAQGSRAHLDIWDPGGGEPSPARPAHVPGMQNHELAIGHHDPLTDTYVLGMILASLLLRMDLRQPGELRRFVEHRDNLFALDAGLHPVLAEAIVQMTQLRRERRPQHLPELQETLRDFRERDSSIAVELLQEPGFASKDLRSREQIILSRLQRRLFGITRRNRLLNFKATRSAIDLSQAATPADPDAPVRRDQVIHWGGPFAADLLDGREIQLERHVDLEAAPWAPGQLDHIRVESHRDRKEFGTAHLRLVVAFLEWSTLGDGSPEDGNEPPERYDSPLLLLPVQLTRSRGVRTTWSLRCPVTEAEVNPVLRHQLAQEFGISLPETIDLAVSDPGSLHRVLAQQVRSGAPRVDLELIAEPPMAALRHSAWRRLRDYTRRTGGDEEQLPEPPPPPPEREGDPHLHWRLHLARVTLGNFRYRTLSLVRDYTALLEELPDNPAFRAIFDPAAAPPAPPADGGISLEDGHPVVPWDPTQERAVAWARDGQSFIIQGPPGTGKSQTISNLIADNIARGKRVLFVCAKRAAIDVVHQRLQARGLGALCSVVHDATADKKELIGNLRAAHDELTAPGHGAASSRAETARSLQEELRVLHRRHEALHGPRDALGCTLADALATSRDLVAEMAGRGETPLGASPEMQDLLPDMSAVQLHIDAFQGLQELLDQDTPDGIYRNHPLRLLNPALGTAQRFTGSLAATVQEHAPALEQAAADLQGLPAGSVGTIQRLQVIAADLDLLARLAAAGGIAILDVHSDEATELVRLEAALEDAGAQLAEAEQAAAGWREELSPADTTTALEQARPLDGKLLGFLSGTWWRLRSMMRRCFDGAAEPLPPTWVQALERLQALHGARTRRADVLADLCALFGGSGTTLAAETTRIHQLQDLSSGPRPETVFRDALLQADDAGAVIRRVAGAAEAATRAADALDEFLTGHRREPLDSIAPEVREIPEHLDRLPMYQLYLQRMAGLPHPLQGVITRYPWTLRQLHHAIADAGIQRELDGDPRAYHFTEKRRDGVADRLGALWSDWLAGNSRALVDGVREQLRETLGSDDPAVRRGLKELRHEFGKTRAHKSVRSLGEGDTGRILAQLKPVWLMSPLSVADTLPLDGTAFDLVIFDEASQVPLEEAVPALFRANQAIIVGDTMQLPPTGFFAARGEEDDGNNEAAAAIREELSSDSLLSHADKSLPTVTLGWHYRSRSEELIRYSNHAFYDGRLLTVPDERVTPEHLPEIAVAGREFSADSVEAGIDGVLRRPVSFHLLQDGCYEKRRNRPEADYIAQLVRGLIARRRADPVARSAAGSLAVVAFSQAQQGEIEAALERLAAADPDFARDLEAEWEREDDGAFTGLIVKNLENIQGDERDTVILSVCYGPDPAGKVRMNFGPINQGGGEKRLNVAFSRAKHRMVVVTSMPGNAITNDYNTGAATLKGYLDYARHCSTGDQDRAGNVLQGFRSGGGAGQTDAHRGCTALADALRGHGLEVDLHVGHSGFTCDLAVHRSGDSTRALGILWDPAERNRDYDPMQMELHQPELLRAFGWRVTHVLATDWWRDPDKQVRRILRLLAEPAGT